MHVIKNIERLNLEQFSSKIYVLTNNLSFSIASYIQLNVDEKYSLEENIKLLLEKLGYKIKNKILEYSFKHWDFISNFKDKTISLKIGSGCRRCCNFCPIKQSSNEINDTNIIISEIEYLITKKKISSFHIENHNLSYHINALHNFSKNIIHKKLGNYMWSCFLIPEALENIDDKRVFFDDLAKSHLNRVFISAEHTNEQILKDFGIVYNKEKLIETIKYISEAGITSIVINFIIGSPNESKETLNELFEFSEFLLEMFPGVVEFNLSMYSNYEIEEITEENKLYGSQDSKYLSKYEILEFKQQFYQKIYGNMRNIIPKLSLQERIKHFELNKNKLKSQYFENFISKINLIKSDVKNQLQLNYYSFEIKDNILEYAPRTSIVEEYDDHAKPFLSLNPLLCEHKNIRLILNDIEFYLFRLSKRNVGIGEIIKLLIKEKIIIEDETARNITLSFYEKLQHYGLLYYTKLFK
jgi:radical SAM superfamily enzyme YgiQ (UPF0313 family)